VLGFNLSGFLFGVGFRLLDWVLDVSLSWGSFPNPLLSHQTRFDLVYFLKGLGFARLQIDEM